MTARLLHRRDDRCRCSRAEHIRIGWSWSDHATDNLTIGNRFNDPIEFMKVSPHDPAIAYASLEHTRRAHETTNFPAIQARNLGKFAPGTATDSKDSQFVSCRVIALPKA